MEFTLDTPRLKLRKLQQNDISPLTDIHQDNQIMKYFPSTLNKDETFQKIQRLNQHLDNFGFSFYAVEYKENKQFIGIAGCKHINYQAHFNPSIEIGWMLSKNYWGSALALEASIFALNDVFQRNITNNVTAITSWDNNNSQKIMKKLTMTYDKNDDFFHPQLKGEWAKIRMVLYRLNKDDFNFKKLMLKIHTRNSC